MSSQGGNGTKYSPLEVEQAGQQEESLMKKWKGLLIAMAYGTVSIAITFVNKSIFKVYEFKYTNTVTMGQVVFTMCFLKLLSILRLIELPQVTLERVKKVAPVSLLFVANVLLSLATLRHLNVPMYGALRRAATLFVLGLQYVVMNRKASGQTVFAVGTMVFGAVVAGMGDMTFNAIGYTLAVVYNGCTALHLLNVERLGVKSDFTTFGLLYFNSVIASPIMCAIVLVTGELDLVAQYEYINLPSFWVAFLMSASFACLLNYLIFLCTTYNSGLTTSVTGQMKNILSTIIGLFAFGDVVFHWLNLTGLGISLVGSLLYTWIKFQEKVRKDRIRNAASHA